MKKCLVRFFCILVFLVPAMIHAQKTLNRSDIFIRDPFVLPVREEGEYYMYASVRDTSIMPHKKRGVVVYKSKDLQNWLGPYPVLEIPSDYWSGNTNPVWAPEVHKVKGKYYLFATLTNPFIKVAPQASDRDSSALVLRGTSVFVADSPMGPFLPQTHFQLTPDDWMSLDGTLFFEDGKPYLVFCHEWIQTKIGTVAFIQLSNDLLRPASLPITLFSAAKAPWTRELKMHNGGKVTDGPWLYRNKLGQLIMLWSSFSDKGYAVGQALSSSGKLAGPWTQLAEPVYDNNGGHPMLFNTFDGRLLMSIHQPNAGSIRAHFYEMVEENGLLKIKGELRFSNENALKNSSLGANTK